MTTTPNSTTLFYVYALARPVKKRSADYRIFYIGKGTKSRVFRHEGDARGGCDCRRCRTIRKVWREGSEIQRYILLTTENEQEALEYEKEMIALHGRENLCNLTDGGEGVSDITEDARQRKSIAMRAHWKTPEYRAKWQASYDERSDEIKEELRSRWQNPAFREKMHRHWDNPEARQLQGERMAAKWEDKDPEYRSRHSEGIKARWGDPEYRKKTTAGMQKRWDDMPQEERDRIRVKVSKYTQSPEGREQSRKQMIAQWDNPEYQARIVATTEASWKDPEVRARRIATLKATLARKKRERGDG